MGEVGREPQYEAFADEFVPHAESGIYNALSDRPACLDLLDEVGGRRVLDAACGPGLYAEALHARGADVTGFDHSLRMVEPAGGRVPAATFRVHDLRDPLDWIDDGAFDLALCALAIEYVDDRIAARRELRRVLRPDGALVPSRQHPTSDWLRQGGSYFDERIVAETCSTGWDVRSWIAPLETTCEEIRRAGFLIERLVEPRPVEAARAADPAEFARLHFAPGFIAFRLRAA